MIKVGILNLTPEGKIFEGTENSDILEIKNTEFIKCPNEIDFFLKVYSVNNGVLVEGKAETILVCKCGKCLSEYNYKLKNEEICHFYENPASSELDLTDDIREDILIKFPMKLRCSENCRGICPECGQNLNVSNCSCSGKNNDDDIWKELDKIKF
ncbi:MAG: DUF177 domain-containing protein [Victivallales bacterium]|nr:DUF177 domain-containing protein [Victivallales bacterium]MCF7888893.1 DUF177 domain-containing protein [Victivallales bacterium]